MPVVSSCAKPLRVFPVLVEEVENLVFSHIVEALPNHFFHIGRVGFQQTDLTAQGGALFIERGELLREFLLH